jgi:hypothetical protein
MAAIRDRQLAARLGPRVLSILSEREVGPGAPPDDVLNIVIKVAPKVINERLEKATFQESPAEAAALDSMWSAVWQGDPAEPGDVFKEINKCGVQLLPCQ